MRSSYLEENSGVSNFKLKYEEVAAARTLTELDSGKVFGINQASAYEITLPLAASAGAGARALFAEGRDIWLSAALPSHRRAATDQKRVARAVRSRRHHPVADCHHCTGESRDRQAERVGADAVPEAAGGRLGRYGLEGHGQGNVR